jgi:hypothetical protein
MGGRKTNWNFERGLNVMKPAYRRQDKFTKYRQHIRGGLMQYSNRKTETTQLEKKNKLKELKILQTCTENNNVVLNVMIQKNHFVLLLV